MLKKYHDGLGGLIHDHQLAAAQFALSDAHVLGWTGATRQGKTRGIVLSGITHAAREDVPAGDYALLGQTKSAVVRNLVPYFIEYAKRMDAPMNPASPTTSSEFFRLLGHRWYIFGGDITGIENRILGMTANGILSDESVLVKEDALRAAFSRLSNPNAKAWLATNKGGRRHWLRREIFDQADELSAQGVKVELLDTPYGASPFIDDEQSGVIAALQSGVFKKRLIDNEWADVEGLIYGDAVQTFRQAAELPSEYLQGNRELYIGVDPGASKMFIAGLFYCYHAPDMVRLFGVDEYVSRPNVDGDRTEAQHVEQMKQWCAGLGVDYRLPKVVADPENRTLRTALRNAGFDVKAANNDVLEGIRTTQIRLRLGQLWLRSTMTTTIEQMEGYSWDERAAQRGEDKPLKQNDHGPDMTRYVVQEVLPLKADDKPQVLPHQPGVQHTPGSLLAQIGGM